MPIFGSDIPIIGPWEARLGRVWDIWGEPCNTTPQVWVRAGFQTLPLMAWHFFKPSPTDYLTSRFARAKLSGAPRFGGKGHKKSPGFRGDTWATDAGIKLALTGALGALGIFAAQLFRRLGFYLTIADLTTEGLMQWSSLVYQYSGCQVPGGGTGDSVLQSGFVNLGSTTGATISGQNVTFQHRCVGGGGAWSCDPFQNWSASYAVAVKQIPGLPAPTVEFFLQDGSGDTEGHTMASGPLGDGSNMYAGRWLYTPPIASPKAFTLRYRADYSWFTDGGTFNVAGGPPQDFMKPDP